MATQISKDCSLNLGYWRSAVNTTAGSGLISITLQKPSSNKWLWGAFWPLQKSQCCLHLLVFQPCDDKVHPQAWGILWIVFFFHPKEWKPTCSDSYLSIITMVKIYYHHYFSWVSCWIANAVSKQKQVREGTSTGLACLLKFKAGV